MDVTPALPDQLAILKHVTARLDADGIEYVIARSIAAGHHAQPCITRDIDLVVELDLQGRAGARDIGPDKSRKLRPQPSRYAALRGAV